MGNLGLRINSADRAGFVRLPSALRLSGALGSFLIKAIWARGDRRFDADFADGERFEVLARGSEAARADAEGRHPDDRSV